MTDKEASRENIPSELAASPKNFKKEKTKYQAFRSDDDDSSEADEPDISRGRRKSKKERTNTFKVKIKMKGKKKEKEKEKDKDKDKDKEKEKKKKSKKTVLSGDEGNDTMELPGHDPIFGVSLEVAVERSGLSDKILLPRIVRECILYIDEKGLDVEGIYRISGVKSKIDYLKQQFNEGRNIDLNDYDPTVVASLLKLYLRELPSNVLTTRLAPIFDACVGLDNREAQVQRFQQLINDLPCPNRTLLAWLFHHFSHVIENNSETKMNIQNLSIVFSPTMSISHGVLNIFFLNIKELFPDVELVKFVPPTVKDEFPESIEELQKVLQENEAVLSQLHEKVNQGGDQDEALMDELWERQRKSTQIKRKIKTLKKEKKLQELTTENKMEPDPSHDLKKEKGAKKNLKHEKGETWQVTVGKKEDIGVVDHPKEKKHASNSLDAADKSAEKVYDNESDDEEYKTMLLEEKWLLIENEELMKVTHLLKRKIQLEQLEVESLNAHLQEYQEVKEERSSSTSSSSSSSSVRSSNSSLDKAQNSDGEEDLMELEIMLEGLEKENKAMQSQSTELIAKISNERNTCIQLKTDIRMLEFKLVSR